jgi:hypothetical protein
MNRKSALNLMDRDRRSETGISNKSRIRRPRFMTTCLPRLSFDGNRVRLGEPGVSLYI